MDFKTLMIKPSSNFHVLFHRSFLLLAISVQIVVLSFTLLYFATCEPFSTNSIRQPSGYGTSGSYKSVNYPRNSHTYVNLENVCTNSQLFCIRSTLPSSLSDEKNFKTAIFEDSRSRSEGEAPIKPIHVTRTGNLSWSLDYGLFKLSNERFVACSLESSKNNLHMQPFWTRLANQSDIFSPRGPIVHNKSCTPSVNGNSEIVEFSFIDSLPNVEIIPSLLDWGQQFLYFPSLLYMTIANTCKHSTLHVYEAFSTDKQFYSCNENHFSLGPAEVASICFVYLPRQLGLSSACLILQTNSGCFMVQAKGFAVQYSYDLSLIVDLNVSSCGRWSWNFSLFNPFDETLFVEQVTLCTVVSWNESHTVKGSCSIQNPDEISLVRWNEWLDVKYNQLGLEPMAMKPYRNWEIGPYRPETITEIDFSFDLKADIFGALSMQLLRPSQDKIETVVVPFENEMDGKTTYDDLSIHVSAFLELLMPCNASGTVVFMLTFKNMAPYLLSVIKINEVKESTKLFGIKHVEESTKLFGIKYVEGFIVFPNSNTKIAVTYTSQSNILSEIHDINDNCRLCVSTNDSYNPQIDFPCSKIVHACSKCLLNFYGDYTYESKRVDSSDKTTRSVGNTDIPSCQAKGLENADPDKLVLENWKTQDVRSDISILNDHELQFSMIQIGRHSSKWITVNNPSQQAVIMQLILNSGEIIGECNDPTRYGFSIAETAVTEVYVHPYGTAHMGPVFFQPSNRCVWRSLALIRNNISGVESITLRGLGGLFSLVMLEGFDNVQGLEFNLNMPDHCNISQPDLFREDTANCCLQTLAKELYAKNTGNFPLTVERVGVSGTECGLDGFTVLTCEGFTLDPGDSRKLIISYQVDFTSRVVHRDLELALATGMLVIPMKAIVPMYMMNLCKRSIFWIRVTKSTVPFVIASGLVFLVFCWLLSNAMTVGCHDSFNRNSICVSTKRDEGKHSARHREQINGNSSVSTARAEHQLPMVECDHGYDNTKAVNSEQVLHGEIESSEALLSESGNLIIMIAKEKRRRRRKRKGSGLKGIEGSSSQSGNSTPSSPRSPVTVTLKQTSPLSSEVKNPFTQVPNQNADNFQVIEPTSSKKKSSNSKERPFAPEKPVAMPHASKLVLEVSSPLSLASYARAPGSKLNNKKTVMAENAGNEDEFTYDIWGDHFSGLHLIGRSRDLSAMILDNNSRSFFARGPQTLGAKLRSVPKCVSCFNQEG